MINQIFGVSVTIGIVLMGTNSAAQEHSPLVLKGKNLAEQHCSRCHVVNPDNPFTGISSTPSFKLLVNALDDWEERFASFYARLPHQSIIQLDGQAPDENVQLISPPIELELDDVDALVAYASSMVD